MAALIEKLFPRLNERGFEITSPRDPDYNCVAWAAGDVKRWWWPGEPLFTYWPPEVSREESIASFVEAFSTLGYEKCADAGVDAGFEKVAIFCSTDGVPTHVARQTTNGTWTSKLGGLEDINHMDLNGVSGHEYGKAVEYLRRPKAAST
jgi:hypothetical protein